MQPLESFINNGQYTFTLMLAIPFMDVDLLQLWSHQPNPSSNL
jgi:hypothetical protein